MTSSTFDALTAARELEAAGFEADLAARGARMYRALWIQGGASLTALRFLPI